MPDTITITTAEYRRLCEADLVLRALVKNRYRQDAIRLVIIDGLVDAMKTEEEE